VCDQARAGLHIGVRMQTTTKVVLIVVVMMTMVCVEKKERRKRGGKRERRLAPCASPVLVHDGRGHVCACVLARVFQVQQGA